MRYCFLIIFCLISTPLLAVEVVVKGYGTDYISSLQAAKVSALEQVTGTWINSEQHLNEGNLSESIHQYNSGVITSYKVLEFSEHEVTIQAQVDIIKDNKVGSNSTNISEATRTQLEQKYIKRKELASAESTLYSKSKALIFESKNIEYMTNGEITSVTATGVISWIPKWLSDAETLFSTSNQTGRTNSNIKMMTSGAIVGIIPITPYDQIAKAIISSVQEMMFRTEPRKENVPMICFANSRSQAADDCYITSENFTEFGYGLQVNIVGTQRLKSILNINIHFDDTLDLRNFYERFTAGEIKQGRFGYEITYNNPTLVIYKEHKKTVTVRFYVPTSELLKIDKFNFTLI